MAFANKRDVPAKAHAAQHAKGQSDPLTAASLGMRAPASLSNVTFTGQGNLTKTVVVAGTVLDQDGNPLAGAHVEIRTRAALGSYVSHTVSGCDDGMCVAAAPWAEISVFTGNNGTFSVSVLWIAASATSWLVTAGHAVAPARSTQAFP